MNPKNLNIDEELQKSNEELIALNKKLNFILDATNTATWEWNVQTRETVFNENWAKMVGYTLKELQPVSIKTWEEFCEPEDLKIATENLENYFSGETPFYEAEFRMKHKNGSHVWVYDRGMLSSRTPDGKPMMMSGTHQDITERKLSEQKLEKANRLYAVISQLNQAIVHSKNASTLLEKICTISIEFGKFKFALVGIIDNTTGSVEELYSCGFDDGYTDLMHKLKFIRNTKKHSPSLISYFSGEKYVCNDIDEDELMKDWSGEAAKRGYKSMISLPLKRGDFCLGIFNLYSEQVNFFNEEETKLLEEVIADINYSLVNFETQLQHDKAVELIKESEEKYRLITENASDVIWVLNITKNKFTYISPAIKSLRGLTVEEALNERLEDALSPESLIKVRQVLMSNIKVFLDSETDTDYFIDEIQQPDKNGKLLWIEVSMKMRLNGDNEIEVIGVSRNIEERKRMESEILHNQEKLKDAVAAKDKFFSIIAHDLKSPFNSILGFSDLLLERVNEKNYEILPEYARIIQNSSQRALQLLSNLLDWSRSQTGRMEFTPESVDIAILIDETIKILVDTINQKSIVIRSDIKKDLLAFADKAMINTVLRNIITNAVKFSYLGGTIFIEAHKDNSGVVVKVRDEGVGIRKEDLSKLFKIDQSYSTKGTYNEKGTGLGLILCKEFIDKHHGKIWVNSKPGRGSSFSFLIPTDNSLLTNNS